MITLITCILLVITFSMCLWKLKKKSLVSEYNDPIMKEFIHVQKEEQEILFKKKKKIKFWSHELPDAQKL